jgi:CheY-like chemotaxis protein
MGRTSRSLQGLSVLIIDDHADTVDVLLEYLTAYGASALGAGSAKAGLAIAESHVLDAAVVDLRMPREDGWSFLSQLRASPTPSAHAAVFAISGERHDYLDPASGFAGYFFKPVDLDSLVAALAVLPRRSK